MAQREFLRLASTALRARNSNIMDVYKAITSGRNQTYHSIDAAMKALRKKVSLDKQIQNYKNIINTPRKHSVAQIKAAKRSFQRLIDSNETIVLLYNLESAFGLRSGHLKQLANSSASSKKPSSMFKIINMYFMLMCVCVSILV